MGDGADTLDQGPGGGEFYAPASGSWGPGQRQPSEYYNPPPNPQQPPPPEYYRPNQQPAPTEYYNQQPQYQPTRRKPSSGMRKLYLIQCYEELLNAPLFSDQNDEFARTVQTEVYKFAERRISELSGEAPEAAQLTQQELQVLKALAGRMMEPEQGEQVLAQPEATSKEKGALQRGEAAPEPERVATPPRRPELPPRQQQPPPPSQYEQPRQPPGPKVIARPTPSQRQQLADRARRPPPQAATVYPPPAARPRQQLVSMPSQVLPAASAGYPGGPGRLPMPQGEGMTMAMTIKATEQIERGGAVISESFVKSTGK